MSKILVVDDSASERNSLARLLRHEGYAVNLAGGGEEALQSLSRDVPDLAVLDVAMPDLDGLQLLEIIHDHPKWHSLPVIMLTGVSDTMLVQRAKHLGAKGYLIKATFSVSELLEFIQKFMPNVHA